MTSGEDDINFYNSNIYQPEALLQIKHVLTRDIVYRVAYNVEKINKTRLINDVRNN